MSDLNRIAGLLQAEIANRTTVTIGTAVATIYGNQTGLFLTPTGRTISAVATNFCYGSCLLAKVEGVWYAANPQDNSQLVGTRIDRFIQRKAKSVEVEADFSYLLLIDRVQINFYSFNTKEIRPAATGGNAEGSMLRYVFYPGDVSQLAFSASIYVLTNTGYVPEATTTVEPFFFAGNNSSESPPRHFFSLSTSDITFESQTLLDDLPYNLVSRRPDYFTSGILYQSPLPPIFTIVKMATYDLQGDPLAPAKVYASIQKESLPVADYYQTEEQNLFAKNLVNNSGTEIEFKTLLVVPPNPFAAPSQSVSRTFGIAYFCVVDRINNTVKIS
jgi:hypothetical protein